MTTTTTPSKRFDPRNPNPWITVAFCRKAEACWPEDRLRSYLKGGKRLSSILKAQTPNAAEKNWLCLAVADHAKGALLERLATHERPSVREAVADRAEGPLLERLAEDKDLWVRLAVAEHAEGALLERLAGDANADVRAAVARRKKALGAA